MFLSHKLDVVELKFTDRAQKSWLFGSKWTKMSQKQSCD